MYIYLLTYLLIAYLKQHAITRCATPCCAASSTISGTSSCDEIRRRQRKWHAPWRSSSRRWRHSLNPLFTYNRLPRRSNVNVIHSWDNRIGIWIRVMTSSMSVDVATSTGSDYIVKVHCTTVWDRLCVRGHQGQGHRKWWRCKNR